MRDLKHDTFSDVLLAPPPENGRIFEGGLAKPQDYPRYCRHNRHGKAWNKPVPVQRAPIATLPVGGGLYVYGGVYLEHFGHFLAEFCHRLWVLEQPGFQDATVLFSAKESTIERPFVAEIMDYLGVKKWLVLTEPTRVPALVIAEQGKALGQASHPDYTKFLKRTAERNQLEPQAKASKKVAMLRGHMPSRRLLGEAALEGYLVKQGYTAFHPETLPLKEQLRTLVGATHLVYSDGSTAHLFDLLPKQPTCVVCIARSRRAKLARMSVGPKVKKLHIFKDAVRLFVPKNKKLHAQPTRALLFAPLTSVVSFLQKHSLIASNSGLTGPVFDVAADIQHYLDNPSRMVGQRASKEELITRLVNRAEALQASWDTPLQRFRRFLKSL